MSTWGRRVCCACHNDLAQSGFSNAQWAKGNGYSRCAYCVREGLQPNAEGTARDNLSKNAVVYDMDRPFAEGAFRYVAKARYTSGPRNGQEAVAKWFKSGAVYEAAYFAAELQVVEKALNVLVAWNGANFIRGRIRLNKPAVWTMSSGEQIGQKVLVEPYIEDFVKFNSNTGWVNAYGGVWCEVFQALSHYSYHVSSGQFLLCDLQGGVTSDGAVLTDPVVQTQTGRLGPTDLGHTGISNFFAKHRCNKFCRKEWTRPRVAAHYFTADSSTSML